MNILIEELIALFLIQSFYTINTKTVFNEKCISNASFSSGELDICPKSKPYCCYNFIGVYYCCEEKQLLTILRVGSIVFGSVLLWTSIIVIFVTVFTRIESFERLFAIEDKVEDTRLKSTIRSDKLPEFEINSIKDERKVINYFNIKTNEKLLIKTFYSN